MGDNLDEAEQMTAAQLTSGGRTVGTRSMTRWASETQRGSGVGESSAVFTSDAEVEAVGDRLSYMYLFDSGVILDRVSFHGRFVHFHLPPFLPSFLYLFESSIATVAIAMPGLTVL